MKQKLFTIILSAFACAMTFLFPTQILGADKIAEMALTTSESQYEVGKEFSVNLRVDGKGQPFTSFKSNVSLNNVTIVSLSKSGSVTKWLTEPSASSPSFFGAISGETTSINVYSLTVKINKVGTASIQLSNNAIYWTDGYTVLDVLGTSKSLTLTGIAAKPISKTTKSSTSTSTLGDATKTTENTPVTQEDTTQPENNEQVDQTSQPISDSEETTKLDTQSEENVSKQKPTLLGWIINNKILVVTFFIILILIVIIAILWVKNRKYVSLINKIMNDNALLSSQSTLDQSLESEQNQSTNNNYFETKPQSESLIISSDNTYSTPDNVSDINQNNDIVAQNNSIINANTISDPASSNQQASNNQNVPHAVNAPSQIPPNNTPLS